MSAHRQARSSAVASVPRQECAEPQLAHDSVVPDNLLGTGRTGWDNTQAPTIQQSEQLDPGCSFRVNTREGKPTWYLTIIGFFYNFKRTRTSSANTNVRATSEQLPQRRTWNRLKISQTVKVEELKETDVVVAVMGPTGSGKSSFISRVAGTDVGISHSLVSHTSKVNAVRVRVPDEDLEIVLVDTPGFDDTHRSDYEILKLINGWLKQAGHQKIFLDGILYLHRISSNRMAGTPLKNLEIFKKICGPRACSRVVMMTTMWDKLPDEETGESRLAELQATFWKPMTDRGSKMERYSNTSESAWRVLAPFLWNQKQQHLNRLQTWNAEGCQRKAKDPIHLQRETVQQQKALPTTEAGQVSYENIDEIEKRHKSFMRVLGKQINKRRMHKETRDLLLQEYEKSEKAHETVLAELHKPRRLLLPILQSIIIKMQYRN